MCINCYYYIIIIIIIIIKKIYKERRMYPIKKHSLLNYVTVNSSISGYHRGLSSVSANSMYPPFGGFYKDLAKSGDGNCPLIEVSAFLSVRYLESLPCDV